VWRGGVCAGALRGTVRGAGCRKRLEGGPVVEAQAGRVRPGQHQHPARLPMPVPAPRGRDTSHGHVSLCAWSTCELTLRRCGGQSGRKANRRGLRRLCHAANRRVVSSGALTPINRGIGCWVTVQHHLQSRICRTTPTSPRTHAKCSEVHPLEASLQSETITRRSGC
jgi:hypothetical protein